jgi:hypothetical protein
MASGFVVLPKARIEVCAADPECEGRIYLCHPYLDLSEPAQPMLVATNGHVLAAAPVKIEGEVPEGPLSKDALKYVRDDGDCRMFFDGDMHGLKGEAMFKRPPPVKFPSWRKVAVPNSDPVISFDGAYLDLIQTELGRRKGIALSFARLPDGSIDRAAAARVRLTDNRDVLVLLMPMKIGTP